MKKLNQYIVEKLVLKRNMPLPKTKADFENINKLIMNYDNYKADFGIQGRVGDVFCNDSNDFLCCYCEFINHNFPANSMFFLILNEDLLKAITFINMYERHKREEKDYYPMPTYLKDIFKKYHDMGMFKTNNIFLITYEDWVEFTNITGYLYSQEIKKQVKEKLNL
jgi:hypothetical protein